MSIATASLPFKATTLLRTYTVDEYDHLVETGVFQEDDPVELLEGYVVFKMPANPPHDTSTAILFRRLLAILPTDWSIRCQMGTRLAQSRPEPDIAIARGPERTFFTRHPGPADLGLVIETSDSSLDRDQLDKSRIYARDLIPVYWIVNLVDRRVEVHTDPSGPGDDPRYHTLRVFPLGTAAPVELDGATVGTIPVDDFMP